MVINTMQIGFKLWKEMLKDKTNEEQKEQFFLFFFVASCFIVLKVKIYIKYNIYIFIYNSLKAQIK
jgi:hypothetical protein